MRTMQDGPPQSPALWSTWSQGRSCPDGEGRPGTRRGEPSGTQEQLLNPPEPSLTGKSLALPFRLQNSRTRAMSH